MRRSLVLSAALAGLLLTVAPAAFAGRVAHHVSLGGPDACTTFGVKPGCNGNFSLVANQSANGTVTGQYADQGGHGFGGWHGVIDCLSVGGNDAWVSGVITSGDFFGLPITGFPFVLMLRDNGTTAGDPPDQASFAEIGDPTPCTDRGEYLLFDIPQGQVIVR
jgi:hypothetical protein